MNGWESWWVLMIWLQYFETSMFSKKIHLNAKRIRCQMRLNCNLSNHTTWWYNFIQKTLFLKWLHKIHITVSGWIWYDKLLSCCLNEFWPNASITLLSEIGNRKSFCFHGWHSFSHLHRSKYLIQKKFQCNDHVWFWRPTFWLIFSSLQSLMEIVYENWWQTCFLHRKCD